MAREIEKVFGRNEEVWREGNQHHCLIADAKPEGAGGGHLDLDRKGKREMLIGELPGCSTPSVVRAFLTRLETPLCPVCSRYLNLSTCSPRQKVTRITRGMWSCRASREDEVTVSSWKMIRVSEDAEGCWID